MATDLALDIRHLEKTYRRRFGKPGVRALQGVSMRVSRGSIFGLLGPNGAGKSTLVKVLMTVIRPTRCEGQMLGLSIGDKHGLSRVGYLPEHHRFPDYLTGSQVLDFYGALAKVPRRVRRERAGKLLDQMGISDWRDKSVGEYSKGMRQRLGVAQALINDPDLIVLDEPTDGVDPLGRKDIREVLLTLRAQGKTVFINSHLLSELEMVCDQAAILVQGRVWANGSIDALTRDSARYEIVVDRAPDAPCFEAFSQLLGPVGGAGDGGPCRLVARTTEAAAVQGLIDRLRADGRTIVSVVPVRETLEDLFMRAVTDPTTGKALKPGAAPPRAA